MEMTAHERRAMRARCGIDRSTDFEDLRAARGERTAPGDRGHLATGAWGALGLETGDGAQQSPRIRMGGRGEQHLGGRVLDDAAAMADQDAIREVAR
jgi:hypothetical protein